MDLSPFKLLLTVIKAAKKASDPFSYNISLGIPRLYYNAQSRNRTSDTRIFSPLLYQLSYLGMSQRRNVFYHISGLDASIF